MVSTLTIILLLFVAAVLVDYFVEKGAGNDFRRALLKWSRLLEETEFTIWEVDTNLLFLKTFDRIYGQSFLTLRRIVVSIISTYLASYIAWIALLTYAVGFEREVLEHGQFFLLSATIFNLVPDFISLQETRWVMKLNLEKKSVPLLLWIIIDIILTATIFTLVTALAVSIMFDTLDYIDAIEFLWATIISYTPFDPLGDLQLLSRIFLLTTFLTSFFWILFVTTAYCIRLMQISSVFLRILLKVIIDSEKPARTMAAFMSLGVISVYSLYRLVE